MILLYKSFLVVLNSLLIVFDYNDLQNLLFMVTSQKITTFYDMSFGKRIKEIRASKKISQDELASKIGIHANHLSRYERDVTLPSIEVVKKIAQALEVSIDLLVFGKQDIDSTIQDKELVSLFKNIEQFSQEDKSVVKTLLDAFITKRKVQKLAQ